MERSMHNFPTKEDTPSLIAKLKSNYNPMEIVTKCNTLTYVILNKQQYIEKQILLTCATIQVLYF